MGKKSVVDASIEEAPPTEVTAIGPGLLLTASLLDKLKTAQLTQRK